ncbi:hypothetical protein AMK59_2393, partial [Oryctes borbonicus]
MDRENVETAKPEHTSQYNELYKYNGLLNNQHDRREKLLLDLKKRRSDQINEMRGIADVFDNSNDEDDEEEPVDITKRRRKIRNNYSRKLMLSEWMNDVPDDLEEDWLFKICPVGVRNIVVADKGVTKVYNRRGQMKAVFQSNLPGGNHLSQSNFTLLDCIYRNKEKTYYVLDALVWNSCSLLHCSTEFRFFFIRNKFLEDPELNSESNKFNFVNVPHHGALLPTLELELTACYSINDTNLPVDGVLFYHKDCPYISGLTPLVGWLKPYMVPEKLRIPIHESYMAKKPKNYTSLNEYLETIQRKYKKKGN